MQTTASEIDQIPFGCETFGRLTHVLLHRPTESLKIVNHRNFRHWLFNSPPVVEAFLEEHDRYRELLESQGVRVIELADLCTDNDCVQRLPNLTYVHDIAVISTRGAILSQMASPARYGEQNVVRDALEKLGIPIAIHFKPHDAFEGCLFLSPETILVAETERHSTRSILKMIPRALQMFPEVVHVKIPRARRFMHADTVYSRITDRLALAYPPAFLSAVLHTRSGAQNINFFEFVRGKGVEIVEVSDDEQWKLACSCVPLEPGVIFHYDTALSRMTIQRLARRGVEIIFFHPDALRAGGGSLRCLTLRLHREAKAS